jgi:cobalt-zinc-cadmium efflux system membrane fusion protein
MQVLMEAPSGDLPLSWMGSLIVLLLIVFSTPHPAFAHGGEIEVGGGARGPVLMNAAQQNAIALKLVTASPRPLSTLLNLNGEVQLLPNRQANVSLRISGQVKTLYANLGDTVRAGQRLVLVQSRLVGDPPPSVTITAPMSGVIDARNVVVGQAVEPNTVLFHISDRSQVIVAANVYEEDLGKIKVGQEARVQVLSYPQVFTGKLTLIDANVDPLSRTVKAWIQLVNPQGLLKPNMFARASVVLRRNEAALAVPNSAIIEANGEKFVFVREGNKFKRVEVNVGAKDTAYSEITDGLVPGDEVVTQGNRQIYTMWLTGGKLKMEDD